MSQIVRHLRRRYWNFTTRNHNDRISRRRLAHEPLEARLALDGSGLAGNPCAPDLDLTAIGPQSLLAAEEWVFDLYAAGATVTDVDGDSNPTGDTIRLQLDPDDTPTGATLTADGVLHWVPGPGQIGSFELIVLAIDSGSPPLADAEVFLVEVHANVAPDLATIPNAIAAVAETLEVTITASDVDGDSMTFLLDRDDPNSTLPDAATLEPLDNNTAVIRWTPGASDAGGTFEFSVVVTDDGVPSLSDRETFSVQVTSLVAFDDSYNLSENGVLAPDAALGVLANDTDSDGDDLIATLVDDVTSGVLGLNADGSFTYTPNADFSGIDSFTYTAGDGTANTAATLVTITVNEQNSFRITENSLAGTVVGQLSPEGALGATVVYSIDDPNLAASLEIAVDDHLTGNPTGSVVLIEYLDFQCPICQAYHPVVNQLVQDFPDDLLVVTRHFPLESIHGNALAAAIAAEAAGGQGAFAAYGDLLFDHQGDWNNAADPQPFFEDYATELGLNLPQFRSTQTDSTVENRVRRDLDAVIALGGTGTPTFFLNGQQITNPPSLANFASLIDAQADATTNVFTIDRLTGQITVRDSAALDFETNPSFSLTVNAIGSGATETIAATITLLDEPEAVLAATTRRVVLDDVLAEETEWIVPLSELL